MRGLGVFGIGALCALIAGHPASALDAGFPVAATVAGVAHAHDGDDIRFGRVQFRLRGIAAPEDYRGNREPGGPESTRHLGELVDGRDVVCLLDGSTAGRYRPVATCFIEGADIAELQVRAGHARDCPAFSGGRYAAAEAAAVAEGRDLGRIYPLPAYCQR